MLENQDCMIRRSSFIRVYFLVCIQAFQNDKIRLLISLMMISRFEGRVRKNERMWFELLLCNEIINLFPSQHRPPVVWIDIKQDATF